MTTYTRQTGEHVVLGRELARGGEGAVYAVDGSPGLVAKLYHAHQLNPERIAKVRAMLANPPDDPTRTHGHLTLAWPVDLLFDGRGTPVGFLMPRLNTANARTFLNLYHAKARQRVAPAFTWEYLLRTARNLASAMSALHDRGYVIGDLNESNIFVTNTAQVTLIDCDSVQVQASDGTVYRCPVGREEYTPPELQGVDLNVVDRTPAHDAFGLGVLFFQLLMQGLHPFTGVWHGSGNPPELAQRIRAGTCPYVPGKQTLITPPPQGLPFATLPASLQALFIRCFGDGHRDPMARPPALEWFQAFVEAERHLTRCTTNGQHVYSDHLAACPWCARIAKGLPDPFPPQSGTGAQAPLPPITWMGARPAASSPQPSPAGPTLRPAAAGPTPTPAIHPPTAPTTRPAVAALAPSAVPAAVTSGASPPHAGASPAPVSPVSAFSPSGPAITMRKALAVAAGGIGLLLVAVIALGSRGGASRVQPADGVAAQVGQPVVATTVSATSPATATPAPTISPTPTQPPTPTPAPTPQPVSGATFVVNSQPVGCHDAPDAGSNVVAHRAPGTVQAMDMVFRPGNGETWHREVSNQCWTRTSPGPVQLATSQERAEDLAADYRPPPPPQQVTPALTIQTTRARGAKTGQGMLRIVMRQPDGPIKGQWVSVSKAKMDVRGGIVKGDGIDERPTDNTGVVTFDLPPGEYVLGSNLPGYSWGVIAEGKGHAGVRVNAGEQTELMVTLGKLTFTAATVDKAMGGQWFTVHTQKRDVVGKFVRGDRVDERPTENTGVVSFTLVPGHYIGTSNLPGYNWGNFADGKGDANILVKAGETTTIDLRPGQLVVAPRTASGAAATGKWVSVFLQKQTTTGAPTTGDRVDERPTDNTGVVRFDLVSGTYAVRIDDRTVYNVVIRRGQVTTISP